MFRSGRSWTPPGRRSRSPPGPAGFTYRLLQYRREPKGGLLKGGLHFYDFPQNDVSSFVSACYLIAVITIAAIITIPIVIITIITIAIVTIAIITIAKTHIIYIMYL